MKNIKIISLFLMLTTLCVGCNNNASSSNLSSSNVENSSTSSHSSVQSSSKIESDINVDEVIFDDLEVEYDGNTHSIIAQNIPDGVLATYGNNDQINAGEYIVTLTLSQDEKVLKTLTASLVITKRKATVIIDDKYSSINNIETLTYTSEGVLPNDDLGVTLNVDTSSSGKKEITGTWTNQNYDVTFVNGTYTITETLFNSSELTASSPFLPNYAPFSLYDTTHFASSVVTKISFPFHSLASGYNVNSSNLYMPVYVVKNDFTTKKAECTIDNGKLIKLDLTGRLNNVKQGDWVTFDNLNIIVGENETLAFGDPNMTVFPGFLRNDGTYGFWNRIFDNKGANNHSLIFNIEGYKTKVSENNNDNSQFVEDDVNYISFLGDSISTYSGVSNSTSYNPTIGSNAIWYPNNNYTGANLSLIDTWWHQAATELDYEICVNNSWSGSVVNTAQTYNVRAKNLHNTSMNAPDIVVVFMGVNDYAANTVVGTYDGTTTAPTSPKNFSEAYGRTITNIQETYENAEVFCCTFLPDRKRMNGDVNGSGISINDYLNAIETISNNLGAHVIDLFNDTGITGNTISSYTVDKLHPNSIGMDLITYTVVDAIKSELNI